MLCRCFIGLSCCGQSLKRHAHPNALFLGMMLIVYDCINCSIVVKEPNMTLLCIGWDRRAQVFPETYTINFLVELF